MDRIIDLKPCPFCGGQAKISEFYEPDGNRHHLVASVECLCCGAQTGNYWIDGYYGSDETIEDAVKVWNRRV